MMLTMFSRTLSRPVKYAARPCRQCTPKPSQGGRATRLKSNLAASSSASSSTSKASVSSEPSTPSDTSTTKTRTKPASDALPYLPRPLGVTEPPTTTRKSWRDETLELMNQDVRLARRKHIVQEATKGYFSDMHATRRHGGKTWIAPKTLIREDHSLYFPDIAGTALSDKQTAHTTDLCQGKVTVIGMLSTAISEEHVESFTRLTNDAFLTPTPHPSYQFLQINLQENPAKAFLVSLYLSSLRSKIPSSLHPHYLFSKQNLEYERGPLGMNNKHIGFVYLVDERCRVRWAGSGLAMPQEAESLKSCVRVLLDRVDKRLKA